jgi:hypothetical protein
LICSMRGVILCKACSQKGGGPSAGVES